jgi:hypothetical protein
VRDGAYIPRIDNQTYYTTVANCAGEGFCPVEDGWPHARELCFQPATTVWTSVFYQAPKIRDLVLNLGGIYFPPV